MSLELSTELKFVYSYETIDTWFETRIQTALKRTHLNLFILFTVIYLDEWISNKIANVRMIFVSLTKANLRLASVNKHFSFYVSSFSLIWRL